MRSLFLIAVTIPFGPAARPVDPVGYWQPLEIGGIRVEVGPMAKSVGLSGVRLNGPLRAYGGVGTVAVRQGLTRDVDAVLADVDAAEFIAVIGRQIPELAAVKLRGRISRVELTIRGKAISAKLNWLGGVIEVSGKIGE